MSALFYLHTDFLHTILILTVLFYQFFKGVPCCLLLQSSYVHVYYKALKVKMIFNDAFTQQDTRLHPIFAGKAGN